MFSRLKEILAAARAKRELSRRINPAAFRAMARELAELADIASRVKPDESEVQAKVSRILDEMDELKRMTRRPEFSRLSPEKRLELRQSLLMSRDQLQKTVAEAPAPTRLPQ